MLLKQKWFLIVSILSWYYWTTFSKQYVRKVSSELIKRKMSTSHLQWTKSNKCYLTLSKHYYYNCRNQDLSAKGPRLRNSKHKIFSLMETFKVRFMHYATFLVLYSNALFNALFDIMSRIQTLPIKYLIYLVEYSLILLFLNLVTTLFLNFETYTINDPL